MHFVNAHPTHPSTQTLCFTLLEFGSQWQRLAVLAVEPLTASLPPSVGGFLNQRFKREVGKQMELGHTWAKMVQVWLLRPTLPPNLTSTCYFDNTTLSLSQQVHFVNAHPTHPSTQTLCFTLLEFGSQWQRLTVLAVEPLTASLPQLT